MSQVAALIRQLDEQIANDEQVEAFIDALQMFYDHRDDEEIVGLEEKLDHVGRKAEFSLALLKKEIFQKALMKLEHFSSAQHLFAFFLSRIHEVFEAHIMNQGQPLDRQTVEEIVEKRIVLPTIAEVDECGGTQHLLVSHSMVRGMVFWLADRCWVRWH